MDDKDAQKQARRAKLPIWAQDEIAFLERRLAEKVAKIAELTTAPEGSNASIDPLSCHPVPIKRNPTIRFELDGGCYLETRFDGRKLVVHGNGPTFEHRFVVLPEVSNSVAIQFMTPEGGEHG